MKFTEFLLLVSRMRDSQRAYYANRTQSNLLAAKLHEKEVDEAVKKATAELNDFPDTRPQQADLFAVDTTIADVRRTEPWSPTVDDRQERRHR